MFARDIKEKGASVDLLVGLAQSLLQCGKVHEALSAYIRAYSFDLLESEHLVTFIESVTIKARERLLTKVKFSDDFFLCTMCHDIMTDPITLKCGHTFSKKCILANTKVDSFNCKKCSESYSLLYLSQLKTNVTISCLIEKFLKIEPLSYKSKLENVASADQASKKEKVSDLKKYLIEGNQSFAMITDTEAQTRLAEVESSIKLNVFYPKHYFKKSELLVSLGRYEEAIISYLIFLTFDSNTVYAKEKATKLFYNLLLRYVPISKHCSMHNSLDLHTFETKSLKQQNSLNGSAGSLNSADSNDSLSAICDGSESSSDDDEIKNCDIVNRRADTEENKIHMIVERFYHEVEILSDSQHMTYRVDASCIDKLDFECPLCMRILWEPVSTPCGHTFCRVCLNRCFDHKPTCPLCKTSLASFLAERVQSSTEFLERAIKYLLPEDYAERKSIYEEEMAELSNAGKDPKHVIPLFVCTIAYPTVPCPLHVFEPRYRLMIRQCMESGSRQFGMCAYINNCIADYGTMLEIRDVQYFPDGRSVVDTVGSRRFRILEKGERDGYHTGAVEYLQDDTFGHIEDVRKIHDRVLKLSQVWFTHLPNETKQRILQHFGPMPDVESNYLVSPNGPSWFWWMLAILPLDPRSQLMILPMTSFPRRLDTLHRVLLHLQSNNAI